MVSLVVPMLIGRGSPREPGPVPNASTPARPNPVGGMHAPRSRVPLVSTIQETMRWTAPPSPDYDRARLQLQRVATHVLARARQAANGRFGLRVTADGIATPMFGADDEVLRIAGNVLIRERQDPDGAHAGTLTITGRSLDELARFAGVDLAAELSVGHDTPPLGDRTSPIDLDPGAAEAVLGWLRLGAVALDRLLAGTTTPSVSQLWPEHFDVAVDVAAAASRVNLGASPGDGSHPGPYLYVAPWEPVRPGDADYWNAPFGSILGRDDLVRSPEPIDAAVTFLHRGLDLLA